MQGPCLRGAEAFDAAPSPHADTCHCTQCRQQSGHVFAASPTALSALHVTRDDDLAWYRAGPSAKRGFYRQCGSFLIWQHDDEDRAFVACGALDGSTGLTLGDALFPADMGDYYTLIDGLPAHSGREPT